MDVWSVCTTLTGTMTMEQVGSLHVVLPEWSCRSD